MSDQDDARALLEAFADFADDTTGSGYTPSAQRPPRLATVDPAYVGAGNPKVTFDGELTMSTKTYPVLDTKPAASDRVAMLPAGRGYLLLGKVGVGAWYDALVAADTALSGRIGALETGVGGTTRYTAGGTLTASYVTYVTLNFTSTARKTRVDMSATYSNLNSGAARSVDFRVQLDGVTLNEELTGLYSPLVSGGGSPLNVADTFYIAAPTVGARALTLQAKASSASSVGLTRASLVVSEL